MRKELQCSMADLRVVKKTEVQEIVENMLSKWTNSVQLQIVAAVGSKFEHALQANYFIPNNFF